MPAVFPPGLKPMLASTADPFDSPEFLFEPKWDGFRCLAYVGKHSTQLKSRNGSDLTGHFPELASLHRHVTRVPLILDGEIIAFHEGRESFHLLLTRVRSKPSQMAVRRDVPVLLVAFDILYSEGESVLRVPLHERKRLLAEAAAKGCSQNLIINSYIFQDGKALFQAAAAQGREGIVAKRLDSPYLPGKRTNLWLKIKPQKTVDAVVAGFIPNTARAFTSLVLGQYSTQGQLVHVGNAGTGFTEETMEEILAELKSLAANEEPTILGLPPRTPAVVWARPEMVVEVSYLEYTPVGTLRHPVFRRRREDIYPRQCMLPDYVGKGGG